MHRKYDSVIVVKLRVPPFQDRELPVQFVTPSPYAQFKRIHLGNGKYGLRQCGYDWDRARANSHQPLPRQQQKQGATPKTKPPNAPQGPFKPEDYTPAPPPKRTPRFSDPGKELAVVGSIVSGLFEQVPAHSLVPADAFTDTRWRIVYSVGVALRNNPSGVCCVEAVNDYIALNDLDREMQKAVDSTNTVSWQTWSQDVDISSAYCESTRLLEYYLGEIAYLYRKRRAASLGAQIANGELELDDVKVEFEEILHGRNGIFDFAKADERKFDAAKLHEKPEPTILLDNKPICTVGNISVVYAKPKAGKSACVSAALASAIVDEGEELPCDFLGFSTRPNPQKYALIHIDTEQSRYDHEQIVLRALHRAKQAELPSWVRSYCVTDLPIAERRAFLVAEMERAKRECGGVLGVYVDGIGDFAPNVNDIEKSQELVLELHALAIRYETVLLLVLHENPDEKSEKTRGHLGSQLERKAESNIRIVKDADGICAIYTERSRHAHIGKAQAHYFKWDEALARHATCEIERPVKDESDLVEQIFGCDEARAQAGGLTWKQLHEKLVDFLDYKDVKSARRKFKKLEADGWFKKEGEHYFASKP